jgi:hypothetical protein
VESKKTKRASSRMKKDTATIFKKKLILASTSKHYNNDSFKPNKFGYGTVDERKMKREKSANRYKDSYIKSDMKVKMTKSRVVNNIFKGLQISSTQDLTGSVLKQYGDGKSLYTPSKKVAYVSKTKATSVTKRPRR